MRIIILLSLIFTAFTIAACDVRTGADRRESEQTAALQDRASQAVGMPSISNFREKRRVRRIYELRDKPISTYTYIRNQMTNELMFLCHSVGYGVNASIQFSNPERMMWPGYADSMTIPQPEPNGLFMPEGLDATYVECANPDPKGQPRAVYVEDPIIVSPFKLRSVGSYTAPGAS